MNEEKAMHKMRSPQAEEAFRTAKRIASGEATYNPLLNPEVKDYVAPVVIPKTNETKSISPLSKKWKGANFDAALNDRD